MGTLDRMPCRGGLHVGRSAIPDTFLRLRENGGLVDRGLGVLSTVLATDVRFGRGLPPRPDQEQRRR
jgi:hypothetical protein